MKNQKLKKEYKIINVYPKYESDEERKKIFREVGNEIIPEIHRLINSYKKL